MEGTSAVRLAINDAWRTELQNPQNNLGSGWTNFERAICAVDIAGENIKASSETAMREAEQAEGEAKREWESHQRNLVIWQERLEKASSQIV